MQNVPDKKPYDKPTLEQCGSMNEKTLRVAPTYCHCTNPITIEGLEGYYCDVDDC
jgi:hypothetical protein